VAASADVRMMPAAFQSAPKPLLLLLLLLLLLRQLLLRLPCCCVHDARYLSSPPNPRQTLDGELPELRQLLLLLLPLLLFAVDAGCLESPIKNPSCLRTLTVSFLSCKSSHYHSFQGQDHRMTWFPAGPCCCVSYGCRCCCMHDAGYL
jgi:hypothetical protein